MAARRPQAAPNGRVQSRYASFNVVQLLRPLFKELGRLPASLVLEEINAVSMDDIRARHILENPYHKNQHRHLYQVGTLLEALQRRANDEEDYRDTIRENFRLGSRADDLEQDLERAIDTLDRLAPNHAFVRQTGPYHSPSRSPSVTSSENSSDRDDKAADWMITSNARSWNDAQSRRQPLSGVTAASSNIVAGRPAAVTGTKRNADQIIDVSTSAAISNLNGPGAPAQSSAPPRKTRHVKLPPPRRPEKTGKWYSVTPEEWGKFAPAKKRKESHVGIIEETEYGMLAPEPCWKCSSHVRSHNSERLVCKVYKESAIGVHLTGQGAWKSRSNCRSVGGECSFENAYREEKMEKEVQRMKDSGEWYRMQARCRFSEYS